MSATVKCWWVLRRVGGAARRAVTRSAAASSAPVAPAAAPILPRPRATPRPRIRHVLVLVCAGGVPGAALLLPPETPPAAPSAPLGASPAEAVAAWRLAHLEAQAATTPTPVPTPGAALLLLTGIAALIAARRT
jgi:hypothetical protein